MAQRIQFQHLWPFACEFNKSPCITGTHFSLSLLNMFDNKWPWNCRRPIAASTQRLTYESMKRFSLILFYSSNVRVDNRLS